MGILLGATMERDKAFYSALGQETLADGATFGVHWYAIPKTGQKVYVQLTLPSEQSEADYTITYGTLTVEGVLCGRNLIGTDPSSITVTDEPVRVVFSIAGDAAEATVSQSLVVERTEGGDLLEFADGDLMVYNDASTLVLMGDT